MNPTADAQQCAHPLCGCSVATGEEYCSDACRKAVAQPHAGTDGERCQCGHAACASDAGSP